MTRDHPCVLKVKSKTDGINLQCLRNCNLAQRKRYFYHKNTPLSRVILVTHPNFQAHHFLQVIPLVECLTIIFYTA